MELIYADENRTEKGIITHFERFDAQVGLSSQSGMNDFELVLNEKIWQELRIRPGYYIYIAESEWGGIVQKLTHSASSGTVTLTGTCWRGLLERCAVCPAEGETHLVVENMEANAMLAALLGDCLAGLFTVSSDASGLVTSGSIRFKSMLEASETLLAGCNGRLAVRFEEGKVSICAQPIVDYSGDYEFSQEYDLSLRSEESTASVNHIIALGRGEMLERQVVQLWLLPDGTITDDSSAENCPTGERLRTLIYDYAQVETESELKEAARKKLREYSGGSAVEITLTALDIEPELGDRAAVRDTLTDLSSVLTVLARRLTIDVDGIRITHTLGAV